MSKSSLVLSLKKEHAFFASAQEIGTGRVARYGAAGPGDVMLL